MLHSEKWRTWCGLIGFETWLLDVAAATAAWDEGTFILAVDCQLVDCNCLK